MTVRSLPLFALTALLTLAACPKGEESVRKAHVFFKNGDLDAAETHYHAAVEANPNDTAAWEGLGNVEFERHHHDAAIEHYQKAIGIDPLALSARHKLAVALTGANRTKEAIAILEETITLEPKDAFAFNALGGLAQRAGRLDEAKAHQLAALAVDPDFHAARFALGSLLVDLDELDEAEREFTRLLTKDQEALAEYGFARIAAKRGRWEEAAQHLSRVLGATVAHPEKIARDPVFASGWDEPAMKRAKELLDRAAGSKTSTVPLR